MSLENLLHLLCLGLALAAGYWLWFGVWLLPHPSAAAQLLAHTQWHRPTPPERQRRHKAALFAGSVLGALSFLLDLLALFCSDIVLTKVNTSLSDDLLLCLSALLLAWLGGWLLHCAGKRWLFQRQQNEQKAQSGAPGL